MPPYVCACLIAIAIAFASDKVNRRGIFLAVFALPAIAGFAILRWATDPNVRYGGIFLITIGAFPGGPGFLAWATNNAGNPSVRAVSTAYVVTLGTAGGLYHFRDAILKGRPDRFFVLNADVCCSFPRAILLISRARSVCWCLRWRGFAIVSGRISRGIWGGGIIG